MQERGQRREGTHGRKERASGGTRLRIIGMMASDIHTKGAVEIAGGQIDPRGRAPVSSGEGSQGLKATGDSGRKPLLAPEV